MIDPEIGFNLSDMEFWGLPIDERDAAFARLRARPHPAFFSEIDYGVVPPGDGYYALTRHADVTEASRHPDVFSSVPSAVSIPDMPPEFAEYFGSLINMDDPRHAKIRRIVSRAFTPRMIQRFNDDVQVAADRIVDDLRATGPCDFVYNVAARLPLKFICDMMGIPASAYESVLENSNVILAGFDPEFLSLDPEETALKLLNAGQGLQDLVQDLGRHRREHPTDDLTSALVNANVDGEQLTDQELGSFFIILAVAGNETTRNAISHGMHLLTGNPDQRALLMSDIERYLPGAVEEIVRYASPVIWMRRTLTRAFEMNGHAYTAGDKALLFYGSANRDAAVFTDPDRFDITRDPNPHVGFGGPGPHFCLGAHLARREITVMFRELLTRVPDIRTTAEPDRLLSSFINGIKHLPCEF
ncbi:MAG TPA: cytochrome P450 [Streptosporangiaceae bacterium]|jgi:cytochrome P450